MSFSTQLADDLKHGGLDANGIAGTCSDVGSAGIYGYLESGFVFRTITSSTYAPFLVASIGVQNSVGRYVYQRVFYISNRSLGLLYEMVPANTSYELPGLEALAAESSHAVDAFKNMAAQMAKVVSTSLLAQPPT